MKIRFDKALQKLDGETMKKEIFDEEKKKWVDTKDDFQLRDVCVCALMANIEEEKIDGMEKAKRYLLAMKIQKANELDLKSEQVAKLKELIGKVYGVLIVGQCYELLEK